MVANCILMRRYRVHSCKYVVPSCTEQWVRRTFGCLWRKAKKNPVCTHTFNMLRALRSIVLFSHCLSRNSRVQNLIWNNFNSRKQLAATVTHLHQRTFLLSCQDDVKCPQTDIRNSLEEVLHFCSIVTIEIFLFCVIAARHSNSMLWCFGVFLALKQSNNTACDKIYKWT